MCSALVGSPALGAGPSKGNLPCFVSTYYTIGLYRTVQLDSRYRAALFVCVAACRLAVVQVTVGSLTELRIASAAQCFCDLSGTTSPLWLTLPIGLCHTHLPQALPCSPIAIMIV